MSDQQQDLGTIILRLFNVIKDLERHRVTLAPDRETVGFSHPITSGRRPCADALADTAIGLLREIDRREQMFGEALFSDPAWCLLLDLYIQGTESRTVGVSSACIAARVPPTTALRWINLLVERGLIVRTPDAHDARRVNLALSEAATKGMTAYLTETLAKGAGGLGPPLISKFG